MPYVCNWIPILSLNNGSTHLTAPEHYLRILLVNCVNKMDSATLKLRHFICKFYFKMKHQAILSYFIVMEETDLKVHTFYKFCLFQQQPQPLFQVPIGSDGHQILVQEDLGQEHGEQTLTIKGEH